MTSVTARDVLPVIYAACDGFVELRALPSRRQCFTVPNDTATRATFVRRNQGQNIYWGVATRRSAANGTEANCLHLGALFADLDFKAVTEADARARLEAMPLPPSIVINSGGGLHCYWLLREPLDVQTDNPRQWLTRLAAYLGADSSCAEPARVLRVPGTKNYKYDPPRPVTVEHFDPQARYSPSEFDEWLPAASAANVNNFLHVASTKTDGPIIDGRRNDTLYKLARSLKAKGTNPAAITLSIRSVNQAQCHPPLDDGEVEQIVRQATTQANRPDFAASAKHAEFSAPTATGLTLTSIGDLLAEPDATEDWTVEGLFPAGGTGLMAGKPKAGKSTAGRALALSVARGGVWLGRQCAQGTVWYIALEGRRKDIKNHFRQMGADADDPIRIWVGQAPAQIVSQLGQLAEQERPALIIIDTMQRFLKAQCTDDYAEMTTLFDAVIGIAQKSGATIILLHHAGKVDRPGIDSVLGSTAITGSVDTIMLLARTERYRTVSTTQRVGEDMPETVILMDEDTGIVRLGSSRQDADVAAVKAAIIAVLQNADGPLTEPEINDRVEARTILKRKALRELVPEHVSKQGVGGKGDPYRYSLARSCSRVPSKEWEQANNHSAFEESPDRPATNACSRSSAQVLVPQTDDLAALREDLVASGLVAPGTRLEVVR